MNIYKNYNINKIKVQEFDPQFRNLVDLFFFSDKMNIDLVSLGNYLKSNKEYRVYFWDQFLKAQEIFWINGIKLWEYRFDFILSLENTHLNSILFNNVENNFTTLITDKYTKLDINTNTRLHQIFSLCRSRQKKGQILRKLKHEFVEYPAYVPFDKLQYVVNTFAELIFESIDNYLNLTLKKGGTHPVNFYSFYIKNNMLLKKEKLTRLAINSLNKDPNKSRFREELIFVTLLSDPDIFDQLKLAYTPALQKNLLSIVNSVTARNLEKNNFFYLQRINELDSNLIYDAIEIYLKKVIGSTYSIHGLFLYDKVTHLITIFPNLSTKKIMLYLTKLNRLKDVKRLIKKYPELSKITTLL